MVGLRGWALQHRITRLGLTEGLKLPTLLPVPAIISLHGFYAFPTDIDISNISFCALGFVAPRLFLQASPSWAYSLPVGISCQRLRDDIRFRVSERKPTPTRATRVPWQQRRKNHPPQQPGYGVKRNALALKRPGLGAWQAQPLEEVAIELGQVEKSPTSLCA